MTPADSYVYGHIPFFFFLFHQIDEEGRAVQKFFLYQHFPKITELKPKPSQKDEQDKAVDGCTKIVKLGQEDIGGFVEKGKFVECDGFAKSGKFVDSSRFVKGSKSVDNSKFVKNSKFIKQGKILEDIRVISVECLGKVRLRRTQKYSLPHTELNEKRQDF